MSQANRSRFDGPAGRTKRPAGLFCALALTALSGGLAVPAPAVAQQSELAAASGAVERFQVSRFDRLSWASPDGIAAAERLVMLLDSAPLDGIDPSQLKIRQAQKALRGLYSDGPSAERAEIALSDAFVGYVRALRGFDPRSAGWQINDPELAPRAPSADKILSEAAAQPSLAAYVERMGWMHPSYAELRRALVLAERQDDERQAEVLRANLSRVRLLPGEGDGRYVLVNTAAQRLYMVENGRVVDSMKVVVGKPAQPTPMLAAMIRFTALNPYWNVPPDLAAERIAPNVVKEGQGYLVHQGYVVLSDWSDKATTVDPSGIDWAKVASGEVELRVRQEPGPANAMGRMKFMFPNPTGVYLHDTPNKELLAEEARLFSGGCVRLEAAPRLAEWLYGTPLQWKGAKVEQKVDLTTPVPVYLAYLTAVPDGDSVVYFDDVYHRDGTAPTSLAAR